MHAKLIFISDVQIQHSTTTSSSSSSFQSTQNPFVNSLQNSLPHSPPNPSTDSPQNPSIHSTQNTLPPSTESTQLPLSEAAPYSNIPAEISFKNLMPAPNPPNSSLPDGVLYYYFYEGLDLNPHPNTVAPAPSSSTASLLPGNSAIFERISRDCGAIVQ